MTAVPGYAADCEDVTILLGGVAAGVLRHALDGELQPERRHRSNRIGAILTEPPESSVSAPGRIRTSDPRIRSPLLCPLSYRRSGAP